MLAVTRTMQILNELASSKDGLGVLELSKSLNIHKADVSRILSTLASMNYVTQQGDDLKYRLNFKFVAMALKFQNKVQLDDIVHSPLEDLARQTGELVQFAIEQNEEMIFVDKVEGVKPLRVASMLGQSAPLHATAVGKVWLASLSREKVLCLMEQRRIL